MEGFDSGVGGLGFEGLQVGVKLDEALHLECGFFRFGRLGRPALGIWIQAFVTDSGFGFQVSGP